MVSRMRRIGYQAGLMAMATLAACGDDQGSGPDPAALSVQKAGATDNQSGPAGEDLPTPSRITVLRGGAPATGAVVIWSANGTGAFMTPSVDTTGADGISTSAWHLGSELGAQRSQADVADAAGSPVSFSAIALDPAAPDGVTIQLRTGGGNRFDPANVTIQSGTTVTWTWVDGIHNVVSGGSPIFTGSGEPVSPPRSYSFTFTTPGTYRYFCAVHGALASGMRGTIVVQ